MITGHSHQQLYVNMTQTWMNIRKVTHVYEVIQVLNYELIFPKR